MPLAALAPAVGVAPTPSTDLHRGDLGTRHAQSHAGSACRLPRELVGVSGLGNTGLWLALLGFLAARGLLQAARFPACSPTPLHRAIPGCSDEMSLARRAPSAYVPGHPGNDRMPTSQARIPTAAASRYLQQASSTGATSSRSSSPWGTSRSPTTGYATSTPPPMHSPCARRPPMPNRSSGCSGSWSSTSSGSRSARISARCTGHRPAERAGWGRTPTQWPLGLAFGSTPTYDRGRAA